MASVFETLLDRFGWPGALLILGYHFVVEYATLEQKRAIIDTYFLGHGISQFYANAVLSVIFLAVAFSQRYYYRRKLALKDDELKRLGEWKSKHQQDQIGVPLHHSQKAGE